MLLETSLSLAGGGLAWLYLKGGEKRKMRNTWQETLLNCNIKDVRITVKVGQNTVTKTFLLNKLYPQSYGWFGMCNVPVGLEFAALEKAKGALQTAFGCKIEIEEGTTENHITYGKIKFILNDVWTKLFKPVQTKSNELFMGYQLDGTPFKVDLSVDPHLIIAGLTGSGKDFLLGATFANLCFYNSNDFDVYFIQGLKSEITSYADCKPTKLCATNTAQINFVLNKVRALIDYRSKLMSDRNVKNIKRWNKLYPDNPMKRVLLVSNEMAFFLRQKKNEDNEKEDVPVDLFVDIVQAGRMAGVHFIGLVQRTTVFNLSSEVKAQVMVITSRQRSSRDAVNAVETAEANKLKIQEFMAFGNQGYTTFKAPTLDEDFLILNKYVPEIKIPKAAEDCSNVDPNQTEPVVIETKKYTCEKTTQTQMTPEAYFEKTGYMPGDLKLQVGYFKKDVAPPPEEIAPVADLPQPPGEPGEPDAPVTSSRRNRNRNKTKKNNEVMSNVDA